ncbi:Vgb family protein [Streptomyces sp. NPDC055796]
MSAQNKIPAGTILLSDSEAFGCQGAVHMVDPGTGLSSFFALGGDLVGATGIAVEADGNVLVSKDRQYPGTGSLLRLSRSGGTTTQSVVADGGNFVAPCAVVVEGNGRILVADLFSRGPGAIIRVNPVTGKQTVLSVSDSKIDPLRPGGLCVAADGTIVVVEQAGPVAEPPSARVVRIDPTSGARTVVSSGGALVSPADVAVDHEGNILVVDANAFDGFSGGVIKVDPLSGAQTVVSSGGDFDSPAAIAVEADGSLLITDNTAATGGPTLFRVDPTTGEQHVLASGLPFRSLTGVKVVPGA